MLLNCIRRRLQLLSEKIPWYHRNISKRITRDDRSDETSLLMQLCAERYYISSEAFHTRSCTYGSLGTELKKNIIEQWTSAIRSRAYVFGINTSALSRTCEEPVRIVDIRALKEILNQDSFTKEEAFQKIQKLLEDSASVRTSLLQGECRPVFYGYSAFSYHRSHIWRSPCDGFSHLGFYYFPLKVLYSSILRLWSL